jgi:hypothetical protein
MLNYVRSHNNLFYSSPELWLTGDGHIPTRAWFTRLSEKRAALNFRGI